MNWKNRSDSRCTPRSAPPASRLATVVFPAPGGPARISTGSGMRTMLPANAMRLTHRDAADTPLRRSAARARPRRSHELEHHTAARHAVLIFDHHFSFTFGERRGFSPDFFFGDDFNGPGRFPDRDGRPFQEPSPFDLHDRTTSRRTFRRANRTHDRRRDIRKQR